MTSPRIVCVSSYRFSHEAMNIPSYRFLSEATGNGRFNFGGRLQEDNYLLQSR